MRFLSLTTMGLLLFSAGFGCAHNGYYTFANTRKLMESNALGITKVFFSTPLAAAEAVSTPATIYMDAPKYSSEREQVYLSYLGMQTLIDSKMHGLYKFMAALMILPIDTAWFPVAGAVDTIYVINRPLPEKPEVEVSEPAGVEGDASLSKLPSRSESMMRPSPRVDKTTATEEVSSDLEAVRPGATRPARSQGMNGATRNENKWEIPEVWTLSPAEIEWPEWVFEGTDLYVDEPPPYADIAPLPLFYVQTARVRQKHKGASWLRLTEFAWNS